MAETALNFGPDWIRALATGSSSAPPPTSMPIPKYSLAEFRYGREEMLALIPKDIKVPNCLQQFPHLVRDKFQIPLALTPMTEDEQRLWTRSVNSEAALRASGKTGPGYSMNRPGRGGSVDRGRGRGRGGYYQRGLVHDDVEDAPSFIRPKPVERSLSANEKDHRWDERDRRYERTFSGRGGIDDTNLKHDNMRGPTEYWRKYDKDEDGDWRVSGSRSFDKLGGRGSWRSSSDRERRDLSERNPPNRSASASNRSGASSQQKQGSHSSWKEDSQGNLPEWSVEEVAEPDTVGTFDSSGAFLETKVSDNTSLDEIYASDDADEGISKQDSPEAKKEDQKKTPKKSTNSTNKQSANKRNSKTSSEKKSAEEKPVQSISEPPKSNSKVSSKSTVGKSPENVIKQNTIVEKQPTVPKEPDLLPAVQSAVPNDVSKTPKIESILLSNVRNSENVMPTSGTASEEDAFAYHQKATENMVAQWTEEIEQRGTPHTENIHPTHQEKDSKWFYQDPQGEIQGPFTSPEMLEWFSAGYFTMSLMVRRNCDDKFCQLGELIKSWGRVPFMPGSSPPPVRVTQLAPSIPAPLPQTIVPNPVTASTSAQLPKQDEPLLALQQQLYQQQLMQQQLMLRQAQMQQLLTRLRQQENFTSLNTQQQQQVLMQQLMTQMPRPDINPTSEQSSHLDPMNPHSLPLLGLSIPPMMKNDLSMWKITPDSGTWPVNINTPQPPGGSIWDVDLTKPNSEASELEKQKKLVEEQEKIRKAEELRLEREREMEEKRKQEELRRKQEEEERQRLEEIKCQQEEQRRQEELRRIEEQRREEEEQKRQEELRRQEELKKQEELKRLEEMRKQEELKRLEERRRQEEEKRQEEFERREEQRRQEELRKQQELRKQEEKKKKEDSQKKQMEKEKEKQLEIERQKEALRQKEIEREERLQREKREREEAELRKLAELKIKSQGPVWGIKNSQTNSELSLADIQRLQEEKERQEREEKMRQQLLQQQAVKQVQQTKNGLTWAKRANDSQPAVKSLSEIQQEEAERLTQLSRMQKPPPPAPTVTSNAGVWGNSSHLNKIATVPTSWNVNSVAISGFWEDTVPTTQPKQQTQKSNDSAFPSLVIPAKPAVVNNNKSKNVRAKKEEDAVTRLFGCHHKPTDEFTKWCTEAISSMPSSVDIPTFIAFLKDIESPYEVYDYVKSYFGEGKEPREFAKQFLEKRSMYRNQAKQVPAEDNTLWGPAPAITPIVNKSTMPTTNDCDGNSSTRGKTKKRKNRMQRLDSSMLGFTVQSNPDRLNVGEIDHIENNM